MRNELSFKLTTIDTGALISGLPYQRPVRENKLAKLMREWDPGLLDPLVVSYRDGCFYLVDGQHRVIVLRRRNGGDVTVPCKLYRGLTYQQEADLCYRLDRSREHLSMAQATNALLEAGTDPEIMEVQRLLSANGFTWALDQRIPGNYEIIATRAVISAYRLLGGADFDRMFRLLSAAWHGAPSTLRAGFLSGMALFLKTYGMELTDHTAVKRLTFIDPEEVLRRGRTDFSTNRAALRYARVLWRLYNRQPGRKLAYRFKE